MGNKKVKAISLGAMIAALFGTLFFIDLYLGNVISYYLYFILPSLLIYYYMQYGLKNTMMVGVAVIFITLFSGSPMSLFYAISSVIAGILIGIAHKKEVKGNTMFILSIGLSLLINILSYSALSGILGMDIIDEMESAYKFISSMFEIKISLEGFIQYWPVLLILFATVEGYLLLMVNSLILPRLKVPFKYQFNYIMMVLPKWVAIVGIALKIGVYFEASIYLRYIQLIFYFLIIIQGFSLLCLLLLMIKKWIFFIILVVGLFIPYVQMGYFILGCIDILVGLKKNLLYNISHGKTHISKG